MAPTTPPGVARRWPPRLGLTTIVSLVLGAGYFMISRGVQNFYPFSIVDMYAERHAGFPSRIMALDARGRAREVTRYVGWRCDAPVTEERPPCPAVTGHILTIGYVDRAAIEHIERHPARAGVEGEPVRVVRRVWRLGSMDGPPPHTDCVMTTCRAVPR